MTNLDRLILLLGSQGAVATAAGVSKPFVSQWRSDPPKNNGHSGNIPPRFNLNILLHCRDNIPEGVDPDTYMTGVAACLTMACPHCGRAY